MTEGVLQDFVIRVKSDGAGKVTAEIKALDREMDDIEDKAKKAAKGFNILDKGLLRTIGTFVSLGMIMRKTMQFAQQGEQLAFMAQEANTSATAIQKLGKAMQAYGGDTSTAASTLKSLNGQLRDYRMGRGGQLAEAQWRFGIDLRGAKDGEDVLMRIAKRMEGLNKQQQLDMGRALGLDPATLRLVQGGVENLNKELERAGKFSVYSEEDIARSRKFQQGLRDFKDGLNAVWGVIARWLLPVGTAIVEKFADFFLLLRDNKTAVTAFFAIIGALLTGIAIKAFLATLPFWLIVAVIALLALVIDDLWTAIQGGDSVFKRLQVSFLELIDGMTDGIFGLAEKAVNKFFEIIEAIRGFFHGINDLIADTWLGEKMGFKKVNYVSEGPKTVDFSGDPNRPQGEELLNQINANVGNSYLLMGGMRPDATQQTTVNNNFSFKTDIDASNATPETVDKIGKGIEHTYKGMDWSGMSDNFTAGANNG